MIHNVAIFSKFSTHVSITQLLSEFLLLFMNHIGSNSALIFELPWYLPYSIRSTPFPCLETSFPHHPSKPYEILPEVNTQNIINKMSAENTHSLTKPSNLPLSLSFSGLLDFS